MSVLAIFLFATAIAAQQLRHVTGVVVDGSSHAPIFGAVISEPSGKRLAVTDKAGRFSISGTQLPPSLRVSAPRLAPRLVDVPAAGANLGRVLLWRVGRIRLLLSPGFAGEHVRWSFGSVYPGGKSVDVKREGKLADDQRDLVFENLEPAQYMITLLGERPLQRYAIPIALEAGADLALPVTIAPTIVDLEVLVGDKPMSKAGVSFQNTGSLWHSTVQCDERGRATEELWQRGTFALFVVSKGKETQGEFRTLPESDGHIEVQIRVPAHTIHGRVVDAATGKPLSDVNILLMMHSGNSRTVRADSDGDFEFEGVPEGRHFIRAYRKGYRDQPSQVVITAEDGDVDHTVNLEPQSGERRVTVMDAAGTPVVGAITFFGAGIRPSPLELTDENGSVDVPPGSGVLFVVPQSGSFAFRSIQADEVEALTITIPAGTGLLTITSESTKHDPIPFVTFILRVNGTLIPPPVLGRLATTQHLPFRTDADGRAQLSGLPPGLYDIWAARTRSDLEAIFSGNPAAPAVTVPVSSVPQSVTLTFRPVR